MTHAHTCSELGLRGQVSLTHLVGASKPQPGLETSSFGSCIAHLEHRLTETLLAVAQGNRFSLFVRLKDNSAQLSTAEFSSGDFVTHRLSLSFQHSWVFIDNCYKKLYRCCGEVENRTRYRVSWSLLASTGLRCAEPCGLQWSDIKDDNLYV